MCWHKRQFYWLQIIFLSGTKCLWLPQYVNIICFKRYLFSYERKSILNQSLILKNLLKLFRYLSIIYVSPCPFLRDLTKLKTENRGSPNFDSVPCAWETNRNKHVRISGHVCFYFFPARRTEWKLALPMVSVFLTLRNLTTDS